MSLASVGDVVVRRTDGGRRASRSRAGVVDVPADDPLQLREGGVQLVGNPAIACPDVDGAPEPVAPDVLLDDTDEEAAASHFPRMTLHDPGRPFAEVHFSRLVAERFRAGPECRYGVGECTSA